MQLTGVALQTVLIAAGIAAVLITAFYLMRLRRRRVEVPFNGLWADVLSETRRERDLWRRLRRIVSWLLQLLIVALLAFGLLDPRPPGESIEGRHVLLLLDRSASMGATDVTGESTRFEQARKRARDVLDTIGSDDRVMLASFDREVLPHTTFVSDPALVSKPLSALQVTDTGTDYGNVADFAADTLRGRSQPHAVILSDGAGLASAAKPFTALPDDVRAHHIMVGAGGGNAAITAFSARRYPTNKLDYELYAEVRSTFDRPIDVALQLLADGRRVDTKQFRLPPDGKVRRFFPSQAVSGTRLQARLEIVTPDAIDGSPRDDRAYAVLPELEAADVLLVTDGNLYLEGALLLNPNLNLTTTGPDEWSAEYSQTTDIVIFDGISPPAPADADAFYLGPSGQEGPWQIRGRIDSPVVDSVDRNHPLMRWVYFEDLNIASAARLVPGPKDRTVVSGPSGPLLLARENQDRALAALAFDPAASDLPLRVAFPMLLFNVVDWMALSETRYQPPYETGRTWSVPTGDPNAEHATVVPPNGPNRQVAVSDGVAFVRGLSTGFYTVETDDSSALVAGNLGDLDEVDIAPSRLRPEGDRDETESALFFDRHTYWQWAILLASVLVLLEWWSYHRRWTV